MKLAAGLAVGYVLGARAGREKYEQIVATARKVSAHPTAVQAQEKAKALLGTGAETVTAKLGSAGRDEPATTPTVVSPSTSRPARRKPAPAPSTTPASSQPSL
ncbi:hypothetical protein ACQP2E_03910 [Actinoplanes sp. CA-015351]|uniref:hypothetical protein n=1 Tax=Actinoplanes sp. CA-015351 TaxID=3239897 RepID=UPI003D971BD1